MSDVDHTDTDVTYGVGGWKPEAPNGNAVRIVEQDVDADGVPIGEPRLIFELEQPTTSKRRGRRRDAK